MFTKHITTKKYTIFFLLYKSFDVKIIYTYVACVLYTENSLAYTDIKTKEVDIIVSSAWVMINRDYYF